MNIEISESEITINKVIIQSPFYLSDFESILGKYEEEKTEYLWNQLGISFMSNSDQSLKELQIKFLKSDDFDYISINECFGGNLIIDNQSYIDYFKVNENDSIYKEFDFGDFTGAACISDNLDIVALMVDPKEKKEQLVDLDKYEIKNIENSVVKFSDFNFKLAVIQQLMYDTNLLQPRFDIHEFIEIYKGKKINISNYEFQLIPEAKEYFEKLPIATELLEKVEEIYQDGGNDIYMNITGLWDGEDNMFNITSTDDLKYVPNLKSITLFYDEDEEMVNKFSEKGLDAEYL